MARSSLSTLFHAEPDPTPLHLPPPFTVNSEFQSSGADRIGRFCALSHQRPERRETAPFVADAREKARRTARRLGDLINLCNGDGHCVADLQSSFLRDADSLPANLPEKLPFLPLPGPLGNRPRIVILMREWLLMAPHVGHEQHLEEFLSAYQELFPLQIPELRILPLAFRLALAERCEFLPSVAASERDHIALLPVLIRRIHRHLEFASETDWKRLGENIGKIHLLLSRDPAGIYPRMDFLSRDAYRHEIEEIAQRTLAHESSIASRAIALAERYRQSDSGAAHVGYFLLGPGRPQLLSAFAPENRERTKRRLYSRAHRPDPDQHLHQLRLDFSSGIPPNPRINFLLRHRASDSTNLKSALEVLAATAGNCRDQSDIHLALLIAGIRHERHHRSFLHQLKSALADLNAQIAPRQIRLFLQTRPDFPTAEAAARTEESLWIPFHKPRTAAWFRQTAGFWCHPLNRPRLREIRPGAIRPVRLDSSTSSLASQAAR